MIGIDYLAKDTETKQLGLTVELFRILTISNSNYEKVVYLAVRNSSILQWRLASPGLKRSMPPWLILVMREALMPR